MKCNVAWFARLALSFFTSAALTPAAFAAPTVYFARDDSTSGMTSFPNSLAKFNQFASQLNTFGVDTIETASGVNPGLTFGGTGITGSAGGTVVQNAPTLQIGNQALLELDAAGAGQVNTAFTFNRLITAFGAFVIQGGDGTNNNPITFRLENTVANTFTDVVQQVGPGWGFDNVFFIGFGDTNPFNKVTLLEATDVADGMLYDNVVAGFVPEPSSIALLLIGGATALGLAGKRRTRKS